MKDFYFFVCLSFSLFSSVLFGNFVYDDFPAIVNNESLQSSSSLYNILSRDFWGLPLNNSSQSTGSYRPLTTYLFFLVFRLFDSSLHSIILHGLNILLHGINSFLIHKISQKSIKNSFFSLLVSMLFAVHSVHVESVAGIVGLADLTYSFYVLISLYLFSQYGGTFEVYSLVCLCGTISLFHKEQGIICLPIIYLSDVLEFHIKSRPLVLHRYKGLLWKTVLVTSYLSILIIFRLWIMNFKVPSFQPGDNPSSFLENPFLRHINYQYIYSLNLWILFLPDWLCFDWALGCIPPIESPLTDYRSLFVIILWIYIFSLLSIALKHRKNFFITYFLPFVPCMNIFFRVGFVIAERNLYFSVFGHSLLVSEGFCILWKRCKQRNWLILSLCLMFGSLMGKTFHRARQWSSEEYLYTSGLRVCPLNAKIYYNIAKSESNKPNSNTSKIVQYYEKSLELWPDYEHALNNLGNVYRSLGRLIEAKDLYFRALYINPHSSIYWMNLGIVQKKLKEFNEAELSYLRSLDKRPHNADCYYNLGNLYLSTSDLLKARKAFELAIEYKPNFFQSWINLIILLDELNLHDVAERRCREALALFPQNGEFYFHLGNILGKKGHFENALTVYRKALSFTEKAIYYFNMGVVYHTWNKLSHAKEAYEKTLELDPHHKNAKKYLSKLFF